MRTVCDANAFVWKREQPRAVDRAFRTLGLRRRGQLYEFLKVYALQFRSNQPGYELCDIVEDDGALSDNVAYFREELGLPVAYLPISLYEAGGAWVCSVEDDRVFERVPATAGDDVALVPVSESFYAFITDYAR